MWNYGFKYYYLWKNDNREMYVNLMKDYTKIKFNLGGIDYE